MNTKTIIGIVAVLIIGVGGYYYINNSSRQGDMGSDMSNMSSEKMGDMRSVDSSPVLAEENAIVVADQRPGTTVTSTVFLATPGYIVIHEDNRGQLGMVIGKSALLTAGETRNVRVTLTRPTRDGERLRAVLHSETDGNTTFGSADTLIQSRLGGPIQSVFLISSDAPENTPISI